MQYFDCKKHPIDVKFIDELFLTDPELKKAVELIILDRQLKSAENKIPISVVNEICKVI